MQALAEAEEYSELATLNLFTLRRSERLLSVIDLLLDVMRDGIFKLITDRLSLYDVIEHVCRAAAAQQRTQHMLLHNHVAIGLPPVVLDERLFTQALISLIEVLGTTNTAQGQLHFFAEYEAENTRFQLRLHDERSGANTAALSALFQAPLGALLSQHNSLQAILSRVVMRAHGSEIRLQPSSEGGVLFDMTVPLMAAEPSVKRLAAAPLFSDQPIETLGDVHV